MTMPPAHQENPYQQEVFLEELRGEADRNSQRLWHEHQQMQLAFLRKRGFNGTSRLLDLGCGPMRLGVAVIPELTTGWYFGQDINPETLAFGQDVLRQAGIAPGANHTLFASDQFALTAVDRPIDIAFSNSLFSHLHLNSILTCLLQVKRVLAPRGVYYSTFFLVEKGRCWLDPHPRNKWGREFFSYPHQDPYHYSQSLMEAVAKEAGFRMDLVRDFGHPTQTMARFRQR
jgi:ubiquinone/menaquinone biosynthesis C-methylase UbiE